MSDVEREDVIQRLKKYRDQLQGLMDLIGDKRHLSLDEKSRAQAEMKALKESLNADYKYGSSARAQDEMNDCERAYFYPAVHQASTQFQARWNSDPIRSNWFSELYAARVDITYALHQLEAREAAS